MSSETNILPNGRDNYIICVLSSYALSDVFNDLKYIKYKLIDNNPHWSSLDKLSIVCDIPINEYDGVMGKYNSDTVKIFKQNIKLAIKAVNDKETNTSKNLLLIVSSHGSLTLDDNEDEFISEGVKNDNIVSYPDGDVFRDDDLNECLKTINRDINCLVLIDACYSGTGADLPQCINPCYNDWNGIKANIYDSNLKGTDALTVCMSGALENQLSYEISSPLGGYMGSLIKTVCDQLVELNNDSFYTHDCYKIAKNLYDITGQVSLISSSIELVIPSNISMSSGDSKIVTLLPGERWDDDTGDVTPETNTGKKGRNRDRDIEIRTDGITANTGSNDLTFVILFAIIFILLLMCVKINRHI